MLLDDLQSVLETAGSVKILSSLKNDKLQYPNEKDIRIMIPDLHLLSNRGRSALGATGPAPTHALLLKVLQAVTQFRLSVKADTDSVCAVYFMGDMLDLWREAPSGTDTSVVAGAIIQDHLPLFAAACSPDLKARVICGNHDFRLHEASSFGAADRRYYFPSVSPTSLCLHGDVFDWIEDFPDLFNETIVYYTSPFLSLLDHMKNDIEKLMKPDRNDAPTFEPTGAITPCTSLEDAAALHPLWKRAWETSKKTNADFNLGLRSIIIGHTHSPRIVAYEDGPDFLALIDTGAWLQDTLSNDAASAEQGTIGAICGNEVRLFHMEDFKSGDGPKSSTV
jgi:hypothetical protein